MVKVINSPRLRFGDGNFNCTFFFIRSLHFIHCDNKLSAFIGQKMHQRNLTLCDSSDTWFTSARLFFNLWSPFKRIKKPFFPCHTCFSRSAFPKSMRRADKKGTSIINNGAGSMYIMNVLCEKNVSIIRSDKNEFFSIHF